jgi:peptidoglycan/xylan/chitin deacetylase (PgdA/CDA1 family)
MANLQITIDDGPADDGQPIDSAQKVILAEINKRKVVAAFFVLGEEVKAHPTWLGDILSGLHVLGNHSFDHLKNGIDQYTDAQLLDQFQKTHDEVFKATKVNMLHWRAPELKLGPNKRLEKILTQGSKPLYTLSHCDNHGPSNDTLGKPTPAEMVANIEAGIATHGSKPSYRILFHVKDHTASVFSDTLDLLVSKGHKFVNFTQGS